MAKYDKIGINYNQTRRADPYLVQRMLHHIQPQEGHHYLDIGCGTGNYTIALHRAGLKITGVDPSQKMLTTAASKNQLINWTLGTAENIPFPDNHFDGAVASLTLHHWDSLQDGFSELNRVLKPNSRLTIFAFTEQQVGGYWLNHYFPKMMEDSMQQMPARDEVIKALSASGFKLIGEEPYFIQPDLQDKFLYSGKYKPSYYLDPNIRKGISSFSDLANQDEVTKGLQLLESDIHSGKINKIIEEYENDWGDYIFFSAINSKAKS